MSYIYRKFAYFVPFVNFLVVFSIWDEYPTPRLRRGLPAGSRPVAPFWTMRLHTDGRS
jgi:hypothetical protein